MAFLRGSTGVIYRRKNLSNTFLFFFISENHFFAFSIEIVPDALSVLVALDPYAPRSARTILKPVRTGHHDDKRGSSVFNRGSTAPNAPIRRGLTRILPAGALLFIWRSCRH